MDHTTGKSIKTGKADMSRMQDLAAECLEMDRGRSKEETGKEHLERNDFVISKQRAKIEEHLTSSSCHPKVFVKEFCYFLMSCHQHCLGVNLLVQR